MSRNAHLVQFYSSDAELLDGVADYLATGLHKREAVVVIATPAHRRLFREALAGRGLARAEASGKFMAFDAEQTMAKFMIKGRPSWDRFRETIDPVIGKAREAGAAARVRLYGEMVDLLWQQGKLNAAIELERQWNRLLEGRQLPLYCAYKGDVADHRCRVGSLERIIGTHTKLMGRGHALENALAPALDAVLGTAKTKALRARLSSKRGKVNVPWAEAALLWLRRRFPARADAVLVRARASLGTA